MWDFFEWIHCKDVERTKQSQNILERVKSSFWLAGRLLLIPLPPMKFETKAWKDMHPSPACSLLTKWFSKKQHDLIQVPTNLDR